jgi:hypothetical protein
MTGSVTGRKVLADKSSYTFNVGSAIPYFYKDTIKYEYKDTLLQVGFPYNVLYEGKIFNAPLWVSKGYFPDRVKLEWKVKGYKPQNINILRREYGFTGDFQNIASVPANEEVYSDLECKAGVLYEYQIYGELKYGESILKSSPITGYGFRSPSATITGKITYANNAPAKDIKVIAETEDPVNAFSLEVTQDESIRLIEIPGNMFTIQAFFKLKEISDEPRLISFPNGEDTFEVYVVNETTISVNGKDLQLAQQVDSFFHVSLTVKNDIATLYVPQTITKEETIFYAEKTDDIWKDPTLYDIITYPYDTIFMAKTELESFTGCEFVDISGFNGYVDEIRIWDKALLSEEIKSNYYRNLSGDEDNLIGYWPANIGKGKVIYDASHLNGKFREQHLALSDGIKWSKTIPGKNQFGNVAFTNEQGNYVIKGVPYGNFNNLYTIYPEKYRHEFTPENIVKFVSNDAVVHNSVNFIDNSSFKAFGTVYFANSTIPVPDVKVLVDGASVMGSDNKEVKTNSNGKFEVSVPIGKHIITVEKEGHMFDKDGKFPYDEKDPDKKWNFVNDLNSSIQFIDTTLVTVIGRVVGGTAQDTIPLGFGDSKNNIGQVTFTLSMLPISRSFNPDWINNLNNEKYFIYNENTRKIQIKTDSNTGEFRFRVPPVKFNLDGIENNYDINENNYNFNFSEVPDSSWSKKPVKNPTECIFYHFKINTPHREDPIITVTDKDGKEFIGESEIPFFEDNKFNRLERDEVKIYDPVLIQGNTYNMKISAIEVYKNNNVTDNVKTNDALFTIDNNSSTVAKVEYQLRKADTGIFNYEFTAGKPNFVTPFTNSFSVSVKVNNKTADWEKNGNEMYILGSELLGTSFFTEGPVEPEIILRDPPGSKSYAYLEKGSKLSYKRSYNINRKDSQNESMHLAIGLKVVTTIGIGIATNLEFETVNTIKGEITLETEHSEGGDVTRTFTLKDRIQTSSNPNMVGSVADVFVGLSNNFYFGEARDVQMIRNNGKYEFSTVNTISMMPDSVPTMYIYSQGFLTHVMIPNLLKLRNDLLKDPALYQINPEIKDTPWYGIAHEGETINENGKDVNKCYFKRNYQNTLTQFYCGDDRGFDEDKIWSYTYLGDSKDMVWVYNDQITRWLDAIDWNEREKIEAFKNSKQNNISYDAGSGPYSSSIVKTSSSVTKDKHTKRLLVPISREFGIKLNETGFGNFSKVEYTTEYSSETESEIENSKEWGYVIDDGDVYDYYSINVYDPNKTIYSLKDLEFGGKTIDDDPSTLEGDYSDGTTFEGGGILDVVALGFLGVGKSIYNFVNMISDYKSAVGFYNSYIDDLKKLEEKDSLADIKISPPAFRGPIFSVMGGATSCPYSDQELAFFHFDESGNRIELNKKTLQMDYPEFKDEKITVYNVPSNGSANIPVVINNSSATNYDMWYNLRVDEKSNSTGAGLKIDGSAPNRTIWVPGAGSVTKILNVSRGISDTAKVTLLVHSPCQYTGGMNWVPDIVDKLDIEVHFVPSCTKVEILSPLDNWVANNSILVGEDRKLNVKVGGYDLNEDGFNNVRIEYKLKNSNKWILEDAIYINGADIKEPVDSIEIKKSTFNHLITFPGDGMYEIRAKSFCNNGLTFESPSVSGIIDTKPPQVFGIPQPADGILSVNDNISIEYNEPIDVSSLIADGPGANVRVFAPVLNETVGHSSSVVYSGTGYSRIPAGISLIDKSFTIELSFLLDHNPGSVYTLFEQGDGDNKFSIQVIKGGFIKISSKNIIKSFLISDYTDDWNNLSLVYNIEDNKQGGTLKAYFNNVEKLNEMLSGEYYLASGEIKIGNGFVGKMDEIRIWSKALEKYEIENFNKYSPIGTEYGLYGYWPLDEAFGEISEDKSGNRHMGNIPNWFVPVNNYCWNFGDSGSHLEMMLTDSITSGMDFTLEFWFKGGSNVNNPMCLVSNKVKPNVADYIAESGFGIFSKTDGNLYLTSKGKEFKLTTKNCLDNKKWHHLAIVVRRRGNLRVYINGELQSEFPGNVFKGILGEKLILGAQYDYNVQEFKNSFNGSIDEVRIWTLAKNLTQIKLDMNCNVDFMQMGLFALIPFEDVKDNQGILTRVGSLKEFISRSDLFNSDISLNYSDNSPNLKLPRVMDNLGNVQYVVSGNRIIINPAEDLQKYEKSILEITIDKGISDMYSNFTSFGETWTAYVHRNQVRWEDERRSFAKEIYKPMEFVSAIKNTGGQQIGFTLGNVPVWLTAIPSSGTINPESTLEIKFTINPALNIGEYNADIVLRTESGYDEKLPVKVFVYKTPPDWKVNPSEFEESMSIVGSVRIEGVLSTDIFDMVAAFKRGSDLIRGVTNVRYIKEFDSYLVFLSVYGNDTNPDQNISEYEELEFRIWDASAGQILDDVSPDDLAFLPELIKGTTSDPIRFEAKNLFRQYIPLAKGWNWVSFNKKASNQHDLNSFFGSLELGQNDQIKSHGIGYNSYDDEIGWNNESFESIDNKRMYQIKISKPGTIVYSGTYLEPEINQITLLPGWNPVGYLPDLSMDVNDALRLYGAVNSDIIKSQYAFSMFDDRVGWVGTLEMMQPGFGYMLKVKNNGTLTYPNNTVFKGAKMPVEVSPPLGWDSNLAEYEGNISVVARLDVTEMPELKVNSNMVLGSFINNNCRGFSSPLNSTGIGYEPFFLTVSNSENGQLVGFRLYNGLTGNSYSIAETVPFIADAVYGTTAEPLVLTLKSIITGEGGLDNTSFIRCYPNPFDEQVNVEFSVTSGSVTIDVVNATGSVVKSIYNGYAVSGINTAVWDGNNQMGKNVSAGIYYIRFISGDTVETVKISKTK